MSGEPRRPDLTGLAVLVVEDEFHLATDLAQAIERSGGMVIGPYATVEDGTAGLEAAKADCALVDINLGEGPCFAMADALSASGVPFVFLTGYDAHAIPDRFSTVERVEKPTDHLRVLEALVRLRAA